MWLDIYISSEEDIWILDSAPAPGGTVTVSIIVGSESDVQGTAAVDQHRDGEDISGTADLLAK